MKEVVMPDFGEDIEEATINNWNFEEGDAVEAGDNLVEVITEKGTFNVSAPVAGMLDEIFFEAGDDVQVGEVVATIEAD